MIGRNARAVMLTVVALALVASSVYALPINIGYFDRDPSGTQFVIRPVNPTGPRPGLSENISSPPELLFGQTAPGGTPLGEYPTTHTLQMQWIPVNGEQDATAGWELEFLLDPDLRGGIISLSVMPPGGLIPPPPAPQPPGTFVGIKRIAVVALDNTMAVAGGWGFNTDQLGLAGTPNNDLLANGAGIGLYNNVMQNVLINIGGGPAPGSTLVTPVGPPVGWAWPFDPGGFIRGPFVGPNFLVAGNNNFGNIQGLQYFENGNLRGTVGIPGTGVPGLVNWWDHLQVYPTPEPTTMLLLGGGLLALARRRRSR
jgi:hypothetical protein